MIAIINTGCANINSVRYAFERLNEKPTIINDPGQLQNYDRAILPGVGHAKIAMQRLTESGWDDAIRAYQRPLLGICLGMQLLCESTEEGNVSCLGHIPGEIKKLKTGTLSSPHMGWNNLAPINPHPLTENITTDEFVYFVHSFAHEVNQFTLTTGEYGQLFSAVVAKDNFAGMQFHPEKSAKVGAKLLSNFINWQI